MRRSLFWGLSELEKRLGCGARQGFAIDKSKSGLFKPASLDLIFHGRSTDIATRQASGG
jgi:hypothetical protein